MKEYTIVLTLCVLVSMSSAFQQSPSRWTMAATKHSKMEKGMMDTGRRSFLIGTGGAAVSGLVGTVVGPMATPAANATPTIYTTSKGVKYAITKDLDKNVKKNAPQPGDIVAIEYTGYLTSGQVSYSQES
jgi:hypothetical protein